jgi:hypothetical protein
MYNVYYIRPADLKKRAEIVAQFVPVDLILSDRHTNAVSIPGLTIPTTA